jgi:3-oxoacyl-[acyl-carrier-protein] synthase-3
VSGSAAGAAITGIAGTLPPGILTNQDLAARFHATEDWIFGRTGIKARHVVGPSDSAASLALSAGAKALEHADVAPAELDLVVVATVTSDYRFPSTACLVQSGLGASRAGAFDVGAGCAGFLYALSVAAAQVEAGAALRVLVCGVDILSRITDYDDPKTCVLFGDGAGAAVVEAVDGPTKLGPFTLRSDGSQPELLYASRDEDLIRMDGREIFRRAVDGMATTVADVVARAGLALSDIDLLVAHQANGRILTAVAQRLGVTADKVASNIAEVGNTSAASIPLALADSDEAGMLHEGDLVVITAFGAGLVWGAGLVRWGPRVESLRPLALSGHTRA